VSDELVEKVSVALFSHPDNPMYRNMAAKAVALVRRETLEEAARAVTEYYRELSTEHRLLLLNRAAAICALKGTA